jgi:mannose-6-phosphate isomerase-like protein (cupin superfamily)
MSNLTDFHMLSTEPNAESPDGSAEIRHILTSPAGDLTHAVCRAGYTAAVHHLPELDEAYYVLAGEGEIWRATDDTEFVTALRPGRWVGMPAGTRFQYRADRGTTLVFLVMVLPSWREELFNVVEGGRWAPGAGGNEPVTDSSALDDTWLVRDLPYAPDYPAPDGSEIRLLGSFSKGGLAHCTLHAGGTSAPVMHATVHEIWFVTGGHGELWRSDQDGNEAVVSLWPGAGVDIAARTAFQFTTTGADPLRIIMLTTPQWPGKQEALPVEKGRWSSAWEPKRPHRAGPSHPMEERY